MFYVEQQPPFTGFTIATRGFAFRCPNAGVLVHSFRHKRQRVSTEQDRLPTGWDADLFPTNMIRPDDVIEIGDSRFEFLDPQKLNQRDIQDSLQHSRPH